MKTIVKTFLFVAASVTSSVMFAQSPYQPGVELPSLATPVTSQYDYTQGVKGRFELINHGGSRSLDLSTYSIATGTDVQGYSELFRVCANGTTALFGRFDSYPSLGFYTGNRYYLGNIDLASEEMNYRSYRGMNFYTRTEHVARFDRDGIYLNRDLKIQTVNNVAFLAGTTTDNSHFRLGTTTNNGLSLITNGKTAVYIGNGQNFFFGFDKSGAEAIDDGLKTKYNVFVKTGVLAPDYAIAPVDTWSDFVFADDYKLPSLYEVEKFIDENNHLPEVPSAEKVAESGYLQHDMNRILLQKIEELTLYTIEQQKEIEALKNKLSELKNSK